MMQLEAPLDLKGSILFSLSLTIEGHVMPTLKQNLVSQEKHFQRLVSIWTAVSYFVILDIFPKISFLQVWGNL